MKHTIALFYGKLPPSSGECREVFLSRVVVGFFCCFFSSSGVFFVMFFFFFLQQNKKKNWPVRQ